MRSPLTLSAADEQIMLPGFRLTRTWRAGGLRIGRHSHDHTNLALCVDGAYDETVEGRWRHVTPATLIVRPAGEPHANHYAARRPTRALIFEALPATLSAVATYTTALDRTVQIDAATIVRLARRAHHEFRTRDAATPLAMEAVAYELIAFAARSAERSSTASPPAWLRRVVDFIHAEFLRPVTMTELAALAGTHPSHVARTFRARYRRTIGDYVRELRVVHGAELLADPDRSIAEIAAACGFYDQSHFTRVFARHFNVAPLRYRKRLTH